MAAGANCPARSPLAPTESVKLAAEEVDPEVLVRRDPQKSVADDDKGSRLRDGVGAKL
jgi:hypothetical protein